ncbi:MAG: hypothetical protein IPO18_08380 [bacterium]|nr:hypothetical protein [bacterium]
MAPSSARCRTGAITSRAACRVIASASWRVALRPDEGGLNLNMLAGSPIRRLFDLGREAGERINTDFDFDAHRWCRYLAPQEPLDEMFAHMHGAWTDAASGRACATSCPDYAKDPAEYGEISQQRVAPQVSPASRGHHDATDDRGDLLDRSAAAWCDRAALRMVPPM